ncbi:MAG: neutral zinc metallopeptidase [Rhodothermales bacterium]
MRWNNARKSSNVEDRRGRGGVRRPAKIGGGAILLILLASVIFKQNPIELLSLLGGESGTANDQAAAPPSDDKNAEFVSIVLGDIEDVWYEEFTGLGKKYTPAKLVLFSGSVQSACGFNTEATGPFYCPPDQRIYIDLNFMSELQQMGASGDFALAYVIAHEEGHHVQNLLGTSADVRNKQQRASEFTANQLSVALELQADCYAGVWGNRSRRRGTIAYDAHDFEEGIRTASVIGDDHLQHEAGRRVQPESFTHGSSQQRIDWLTRGLEYGDPKRCNTFD